MTEQQRVRLTLDDEPAAQEAVVVSGRVDSRREEMLWLASEASPYAGQWVALHGSRLIAHGMDAAAVRAAARVAGAGRPLLIHLPEEATEAGYTRFDWASSITTAGFTSPSTISTQSKLSSHR